MNDTETRLIDRRCRCGRLLADVAILCEWHVTAQAAYIRSLTEVVRASTLPEKIMSRDEIICLMEEVVGDEAKPAYEEDVVEIVGRVEDEVREWLADEISNLCGTDLDDDYVRGFSEAREAAEIIVRGVK